MAVLQFLKKVFSFYSMWMVFGLHVCLHIRMFGMQCQQRPEEELDLQTAESYLSWEVNQGSKPLNHPSCSYTEVSSSDVQAGQSHLSTEDFPPSRSHLVFLPFPEQ